jgi:hypothetical protein
LNTPNPYAPPKAAVRDISSAEAAPSLWNPNAAASWSLLLSPVFGAILQMKNWQAMGEAEKAGASRQWAIGCFIVLVGFIIASAVLPDSKAFEGLTRAGGIGLLIAWYYGNGKAQNAHVLARYGKNYPRKGWLRPLFYALLALFALIVVAALVGGVIGAISGSP